MREKGGANEGGSEVKRSMKKNGLELDGVTPADKDDNGQLETRRLIQCMPSFLSFGGRSYDDGNLTAGIVAFETF